MKFSENGISQDVIDVAAAIMRGEKIEEKKKMDPVDKKELKGTHAQRDDKDIDNDGDADASDEYLHKKRKAISKAVAKEDVEQVEEADLDESASYAATQNAKAHAKKDGANYNDQSVAHKYNALHMKKAGFTHFKNTRMGGREYNKMGVGTKIGPEHHKGISEESVDMDAKNAEKAVKHDCATHVVHKEHGEGRCVPGMHTLEENEDGTGYVTHYDVMFQGEDGPYIVEDCPVEDLEIVQEMSHGHKKKK